LPDINGFELAQTIRNMEKRWHRVPLIAVTANAFEGLSEKTKQAGFDDYLFKPLNIEAIRHIFLKYLSKAKRSLLNHLV
jgi:two-component system, sensor histidine kinase and response regulator